MNSTSVDPGRKVATGNDSALSQALFLARMGLKLIPVHGVRRDGRCSCEHPNKQKPCNKPGKHPRERSWTTNGTTDSETICGWFKKWQRGNYGVVTGLVNHLVVLDFDARSGGLETLETLMKQAPNNDALNHTFAVATPGGGRHYYFLASAPIACKQGLMPGLDVRGDGGLAVGPGSQRQAGAYTIIQDWPTEGLPELPPNILQQVDRRGIEEGLKRIEKSKEKRSKGASAPTTAEFSRQIDTAQLTTEEQDVIRGMLKATLPTAQGTRHKQVFRLAQQLRGFSDWWNCHPGNLKQIVKRWHEMAQEQAQEQGFTINGSFAETWGDFTTAWPRVRARAGRAFHDVCTQAADIMQADALPLPVAECVAQVAYGDRRYTVLILVCWLLREQWQNGEFPLSCAKAHEAVSKALPPNSGDTVSTPWAGRALELLVRDGVLSRPYKAPRGGTGKASKYCWTWTPQPTSPPLDWL